MKKCTSCSKDLPDAALHCVFCGAKQAAAPAQQQPGLAKTVMGYSAQEMIQQIRQQQAAGGGQPLPPPPVAPVAAPPPPPPPAPVAAPPPRAPLPANMAPTMMVSPDAARPLPVPHAQPMGNNLPTMAAQPMPPPPAASPAPVPAPMSAPVFGSGAPGPGPSMGGPMSRDAGTGSTPVVLGGGGPAAKPAPAPIHAPAPAPRRAGVAGADPLGGSLKLVMLIFGILLLASFAVPMSTDPMMFHWDGLGHLQTLELVATLLLAGIGVLAILFAVIPMGTGPRGLIIGILAVAAILIPLINLLSSDADFPTKTVMSLTLGTLGPILVIAGLVARDGHRDAMLGRLLVTIGVLAGLALFLIPDDDKIPLVDMFKELIDAKGAKGAIEASFGIVYFVLFVATLLVWLPAPSGAGAKVFAWLIVLLPVAMFFVIQLFDLDQFTTMIGKTPNDTLLGWVPQSSYFALGGWGLGAGLGKMVS